MLIQKNPALTPDQVKVLLMKTTYKNLPTYSTVTDAGVTYTMQYDAFTVGTGYLDLQAATSATEIPPSSMSAALSGCNLRCQLRLYLLCAELFHAWRQRCVVGK